MKETAQQFYKSKTVKIVTFSLICIFLTACSGQKLEKSEINVEINGPSKYPTDIRENIKKTLNEQSK